MAVISTGAASEWTKFDNRTEDGRPVAIRSRLALPEVREFALANVLLRARCAFPPSQVDEEGMPRLTSALDEWEEKLLAEIDRAQIQGYPVAVVTGASVRDYFLAASDGDALLAAIGEIEGSFPFELQLARVDGPRDALFNSLTPPG